MPLHQNHVLWYMLFKVFIWVLDAKIKSATSYSCLEKVTHHCTIFFFKSGFKTIIVGHLQTTALTLNISAYSYKSYALHHHPNLKSFIKLEKVLTPSVLTVTFKCIKQDLDCTIYKNKVQKSWTFYDFEMYVYLICN